MKIPSRKHLLAIAVLLLALALIPILKRGRLADNPPSKPAASAGDETPGNPPLSRPRPSRDREADRQLTAEGALTDVSLSTFPIKEYQHMRAPAGKAAGAPAGEAYIHVPSAGRRIAMDANQIGEYPAIETELRATVGVRLRLDSVKPGTPVRVVILDGGSFPKITTATQVIKAADWRGVAFEFTTSGNIGHHRVLVQAQGQTSRILNFSAHDPRTWPAPSTASTR
jgi:hypothetical protein